MSNPDSPHKDDSTTLKLIGCLFILFSFFALFGFFKASSSLQGHFVSLTATAVLLAVGIGSLVLSRR